MTSALRAAWRRSGTLGLVQSARDRLTGTRSSLADEALAFVTCTRGIEIGGPSNNFQRRGMLPLYPVMSAIDNVNFSTQTLWEKALEDGTPYAPMGIRVGTQFLREATDLRGIPESYYDGAFSSHCLEHIANPLRALREWRRVCRPGGFLCLVVPHRDGSFDRNRPVTSLEHYRSDFQNNVDESDDTHFDEVVRCHDLRRDPGVRSMDEFKRRVADNLTVRGIHHHVFDLGSAVQLIGEAGWTPTAAEARRPYDIVVLAQNLANKPEGYDAESILRSSPFRSDR